MPSEVFQRQPAAPEGFDKGRSDNGLYTDEADPEAGLCLYWHGELTVQDVDGQRSVAFNPKSGALR